MASINVTGAFKTKNEVLRKLLHKGKPVGLRLWGPTPNSVGGRQALLTLTSGWYHKQSKVPETGEVNEQVNINQTSVMTQEVLDSAGGFDILYADETFERYTFGAKGQPSPIGGEWKLTVTPSFGDTRELDEPGP